MSAKTKSASVITGAQYRALKAISGKHPLTRRGIAEAAFGGNSINFVPILDPMVKAKLVKVIELGSDPEMPDVARETLFHATAAGKKIASGPAPVTRTSSAEHQPLPKAGGTFTKTYKGKEYKVTVQADGTFKVGGKSYTSLTAAAKGVRGSEQEVNGWAFFGLTKAATK